MLVMIYNFLSLVIEQHQRLTVIHMYMWGQVKQIAQIHHIHLVKLIGYYDDSYQQLLVYEYLPNGNVGNHLYGTLS